MRDIPQPKGYPVLGHLPFWAGRPLELLEEGAALGDVFALKLGRAALVGYTSEWNRMILSDLETFRSRGSFSSITPYLNGGIITTDHPEHKPKKKVLDAHFHAKAMAGLCERLSLVIEKVLPSSDFEAGALASRVAQLSLNEVYFRGQFPAPKLAAFLRPLKQPFPAPLLPRPVLFAQIRQEVRQLQAEGLGIAAHVPLEEVMIGLAAGYDTTAHTLAWALWQAAQFPEWHNPQGHPLLIKETLRLYPPGFVGSRKAAIPFEFGGQIFPKEVLVLYSPYLTHRQPELWQNPLEFNPARFEGRIPAWGYLPFGGGERICLGMHFANMVLEVALGLVGRLEILRGDPTPKPGLTLAPRGELWLRPTKS